MPRSTDPPARPPRAIQDIDARIAALRSQLGGSRDGAMLRFALGSALLTAHDAAAAVLQLRRALDFDPDYSAAWKLLGTACRQAGDRTGAADAWRRGIEAAGRRGDVQAAREMQVFLRRLESAA